MFNNIRKEASKCINQFLKFDRTVKQQNKIIYEEKFIVAAKFSYDYLNSQNQSFFLLTIEDIKHYLQIIFNFDNNKIFLMPIIVGKDPNYQCRLIWIEARRFNNQLISFAQCIGNDYCLSEKNKDIISGLNIQLLPNIDLSVNTLIGSLEFIKSRFCNRLNLFALLTNQELHYINLTYPEINDKLNIINHNDGGFNSVCDVINSRTHLINEIIAKLTQLKWYDFNAVINSYLLRKLHTGTDRYLNDKNFLIYNVQYFKELQILGRKYNDEYRCFSLYNVIEFQILLGLNDYINLKQNNIINDRRKNLEEYFNQCTTQDYIHCILGSSASIKNITNIKIIYDSIQKYMKVKTPASECFNFSIIKIELGGSELGKIVAGKLELINTMIKNITQVSVYKVSNKSKVTSKIKNWMIMKWSDILFIQLTDEQAWELYIKIDDFNFKKIKIFNNSLMFSILNEIEIQQNRATFSISQLEYFLEMVHLDFDNSFEINSLDQVGKSTRPDVNQEYVQAINFFSEKSKISDHYNFSQSEIKYRIENLENAVSKISILEKNINSLKLEISKLTNLNIELREELIEANCEIKQKIIKIFSLYSELLLNLEAKIYFPNHKITIADANEVILKVKQLLIDPDINMPDIKIKSLFDQNKIDLCYVTSLNIPICDALTLCFSENAIKIISAEKASKTQKVQDISDPVLIDKLNVLLKEEGEYAKAKNQENIPIVINNPILLNQLFEFLKENNLYNHEMVTDEIRFKQEEIKERCDKLLSECYVIANRQNDESNKNLCL